MVRAVVRSPRFNEFIAIRRQNLDSDGRELGTDALVILQNVALIEIFELRSNLLCIRLVARLVFCASYYFFICSAK